MRTRGLRIVTIGRRGVCARLRTLSLILPLLTGCSVLTGPQNVPPPWEGPAAAQRSLKAPAPAAATRAAPLDTRAAALPPESLDAATASPDRPAIYGAEPGAMPAPTMTSARPAPSAALPPSPSRRPSPPRLTPLRTAPETLRLDEHPAAFGSPRTVATIPPSAGPSGYVIGVGDTVLVTVFGQPDLSATVIVSDDGSVPLSLVGKTRVAGLTPAQAADHIADEFRRGQYLINPQVSVTLQQYLSQQISVLGDVKNPGRFPVSVRLTVLDALALAGGVTDTGSQRIYVLRPDAGGTVTRYEIDVEALMLAGAGQEYFDVRAGDTLMVPRAEVFYIYGEVRTPNSYKLRPDMTVMQAISLGGGLTDKGSDRRVQLRRKGADGRTVSRSAALTDRVEPDDVIFVRERLF